MTPRAGSLLSPLVHCAKLCDAPSSRALRSRPAARMTSAFSTTTCQSRRSKPQHQLHAWLKAEGSAYRDVPHPEEGPQYLSENNQPFPMNPYFRSQPVLSEELREEIYRRVREEKQSLKLVSAQLSVDIRRVAAVVRMMEVEKQWVAEGKPLARPYARILNRMLPQTPLRTGDQRQIPHEPINDIHIHKLTMQQLFVPVAESRQFNREDAAKAFHRTMLSVDERSPHKQLIDMQRQLVAGGSKEELDENFRMETKAEEDRLLEMKRRSLEKVEKATRRVETGRFEFRFKEMEVDSVGKTGRDRGGVGWRYGVPFYDRKKGQVKIPTSVP